MTIVFLILRKRKPKEAEVVMLILDKIDFKTRLLQKTKMDII